MAGRRSINPQALESIYEFVQARNDRQEQLQDARRNFRAKLVESLLARHEIDPVSALNFDPISGDVSHLSIHQQTPITPDSLASQFPGTKFAPRITMGPKGTAITYNPITQKPVNPMDQRLKMSRYQQIQQAMQEKANPRFFGMMPGTPIPQTASGPSPRVLQKVQMLLQSGVPKERIISDLMAKGHDPSWYGLVQDAEFQDMGGSEADQVQ